MRRLLLAILLVTMALAPAAVAQSAPQGCGPFDVRHTTPDDVPAGGQASVTVTIKNNGNVAADVVVPASVAESGWNVTPPQQTLTGLAAGASGTAVFTVAASANAKPSATVNFAPTATCTPNSAIPCTGPVSQACTAQLKADSVVINLVSQSGFKLPDLTKLPIEYVIAAIVLLGVAVAVVLLARRKPGGGATLSCPEPLKPVKPGKGTSFPVELRNSSDKPTKLALNVGAVPQGWSAFLPLPEIQLAPREARSLWLMVRAPSEAKPGQTVDVEVTALDAGVANAKPKTMRVRAEVADGDGAATA